MSAAAIAVDAAANQIVLRARFIAHLLPYGAGPAWWALPAGFLHG
jgi:hypothetical protein